MALRVVSANLHVLLLTLLSRNSRGARPDVRTHVQHLGSSSQLEIAVSSRGKATRSRFSYGTSQPCKGTLITESTKDVYKLSWEGDFIQACDRVLTNLPLRSNVTGAGFTVPRASSCSSYYAKKVDGTFEQCQAPNPEEPTLHCWSKPCCVDDCTEEETEEIHVRLDESGKLGFSIHDETLTIGAVTKEALQEPALQPGFKIKEVNGVPVSTREAFDEQMGSLKEFKIKVEEQVQEINVRLSESGQLGFTIDGDTLTIDKVDDEHLQEPHLQQGSKIKAVNGVPVTTKAAFDEKVLSLHQYKLTVVPPPAPVQEESEEINVRLDESGKLGFTIIDETLTIGAVTNEDLQEPHVQPGFNIKTVNGDPVSTREAFDEKVRSLKEFKITVEEHVEEVHVRLSESGERGFTIDGDTLTIDKVLDGNLQEQHLQTGSIIKAVNGAPVMTKAEFVAKVRSLQEYKLIVVPPLGGHGEVDGPKVDEEGVNVNLEEEEVKLCSTGVPSGLGISSDCDGKLIGQACTASCVTGYTGSSETFTCQEDQTFSGTAPNCIDIAEHMAESSKVVAEGFKNLSTGMADVVNATKEAADGLKDAAHGFRTHMDHVASASKEAADGLQDAAHGFRTGAEAARNAHAARGQHDVSTPAETRKDVGASHAVEECTSGLPSGTGVTSDCNGKTTGQECTASCEQPKYTQAQETFMCQADHSFSGTNPTCKAKLERQKAREEPSTQSRYVSLNGHCTEETDYKRYCKTGVETCGKNSQGPHDAGTSEPKCRELCDSMPSCVAIAFKSDDQCVIYENQCTDSGDVVRWGYKYLKKEELSPGQVICTTGQPSGTGVTSNCEGQVAGETCKASCMAGYRGSETEFTCHDDDDHSEEFSGTNPTCTAEECTQGMPEGDGISSDCVGKTTGQECKAFCAAGYSGDEVVFTCKPSHTFSSTSSPSCTPRECTSGLPSGDGVSSDCTGKTTGQACKAICTAEYTGAETEFKCGTDASFSGTNPTCTKNG